MIHSGSRGFGHQVCTDHLASMNAGGYGFDLPDRQLACAPVDCPPGATTWRPWPPPTSASPTGR